jgi:quercetin dioxygenase-like cupin family protein
VSIVTPKNNAEQEAVWWQGGLFRIKGRAGETGGAIGLVEANLWAGMATPLHVHHREDEAFYILEGQMRFRRGDKEFTAGEGDFVFGPREIAHSFKVLEGGARALVLMTPAGLEQMFIDGGVPVRDAAQPPAHEYDVEHAMALAKQYGWDVVGPPLA